MFKHDLGDGAYLQPLEPRHAQEFLDFLTANREHLLEWLNWEHLFGLEEAQKYLAQGMTRYAEDSLPWVGIWQDGRMAGGVLFFPVDKRTKSSEIGYWLGRGFTGRGLVTRAARAMLNHAFGELGLKRMALLAATENRASRRVAERLGFTLEGVLRKAGLCKGQTVDLAAYSMLAEEWARLEAAPQ
ncbi:MAG: GNAT family protein [Meiothermus sp.]|nr:GNAT family protein [Meiothermus sp.]